MLYVRIEITRSFKKLLKKINAPKKANPGQSGFHTAHCRREMGQLLRISEMLW